VRVVIYLIFTSLFFTGCASTGVTTLDGAGIHIEVGEKILNDEAKLEELTDQELVETMHRYLSHRFRKLKVRGSLKFDVTVTGLRLRTSRFSGGNDRINVDVIVTESGIELKTFSEFITTRRSRSRSVKRMSKGLAKRIYAQIQDL